MSNILQSTTQTFVDNSSKAGGGSAGFFPNSAPVGWILLLVAVITLFTNSVLMVAYVKFRQLRGSFSVYLISLCIGDFTQALLVGLGNFVLFFTNGWPLGRTACNIFQYGNWAINGLNLNLHLTISLNRLWAVTFPGHYKAHHDTKTAVGICVGVWLYAHVWTLPALIPDALYYRANTTEDCSVNTDAQPKWGFWCNTLFFNSPGLVMALAYVIIILTLWRQRKIVPGQLVPPPDVSVERNLFRLENHKKILATIKKNAELSRSRFTGSGKAHRTPINSSTIPRQMPYDQWKRRNKKAGQFVTRKAYFKMLHLLIVGALLCWTPLCTCYVLLLYGYYNLAFLSVAMILFYANSLLNPIVYPLASKEWLKAIKQVLHVR